MERDGFISYSHKRDRDLAQALQRGLHALARPWTRRPVLNVFRDTTSLSANHDLWSSILTELERSRYLIYLASPLAAESRWVRKEIEFWLGNRPLDRFLIAVSDGTIAWDVERNDFDWDRTDALPSTLRGKFPTEPLWVDLTQIRELGHFSLRQADFRDAVATLAAPMHGRTKDELDSRDIRERRIATRLRRGAITGLALLLVTSLAAAGFAWQQRGEALARARVSASQALAARSLELADTDPRKAAQFALYAEQVEPTGESAQALAQAVEANGSVVRHFQGGKNELADFRGAGTAPQSHVAMSRDGGTLAYYSDLDDRLVHLYDTRADRELRSLPTDGGLAQNGSAPLLSRDGHTLALEAAYNRIEIWDVRQARRLRTIKASRGEDLGEAGKRLRSFALSGDGRWTAATYYAPAPARQALLLGIWDTRTGKPLFQGAAGSEHMTLVFQDGDERLVAVDAAARSTRLYDLTSRGWVKGVAIPGLATKDGVLHAAEGNPRRALVGSYEQKSSSELWDLVAGRRLARAATGPLPNAALPADNPDMVVGSHGNAVFLYDAALRRGSTLGAFTWGVTSVAASGDGRWVAAASSDGAVSLYSTLKASASDVKTPKDVQFTRDGRLAYRSSWEEKRTELWFVAEGQDGLRRLGEIPRAVNVQDGAIAVNRNGTRVALYEDNGALSLWDPRTGRRVDWTLRYDRAPRLSAAGLYFLADDVHVVSESSEGILTIDTRTWDVSAVVGEKGDYGLLGLSGDKQTLAAADESLGDIVVWRWLAEESRFRQTRTAAAAGTSARLLGVAVSHAGEKVATVDADSRITILDIGTGHVVTSSGGAGQGLASMFFSRDARLLAQPFGGGEDSGIGIWDTATGDALGTWSLAAQGAAGPDMPVEVVQAPDGGILSLGQDGSLVRRQLGATEWRATLCSLVPEPLPKEDYDRYLSDLDVTAPCPSR
ncbi:TIR domain-containing protein [Streptomyces sp. NPDC002238]|uniref:TIR domain-containing protein n=1 Tax=Streptomyces sp. NPDC002238 TaxID=3156649 RepID=UPI0033171D54